METKSRLNQAANFLVVGATGQQGGSVARHLHRRGFTVRALTRSPNGQAARSLAALGMEVVAGDLEEPETLEAALIGVTGVFSVQNFYEKGVGYDGEIRQGRALIDAAKSTKVAHFVQSTMASTPDAGGVRHFESKFEVERYVQESGLPFTLIGTVWLMDNMLNPKMGGPMTFPALAGTLRKETRFHMLAVDDLGVAVTEVFSDPARHIGKKHNLAGDIMTIPQMKSTYRRVTGEEPKRWGMPNPMLRLFARDFAPQLRWG